MDEGRKKPGVSQEGKLILWGFAFVLIFFYLFGCLSASANRGPLLIEDITTVIDTNVSDLNVSEGDINKLILALDTNIATGGNFTGSDLNITDLNAIGKVMTPRIIGSPNANFGLDLNAYFGPYLQSNAGRLTFNERVVFKGITKGAGPVLISWSETLDARGESVIIPAGFSFLPIIEYDTAQVFSVAPAFVAAQTWDETAAIGGTHTVLSINGFSSGPEITMSHGGTYRSPTTLSGYAAEPMIFDGGAGGGTMTVNEVNGYTTNAVNSLRGFFGGQQINGGTVTTYSHFKANSQNQLLTTAGGSIGTEIGLDLANINVGTTKISLRSTGTSAYMHHVGDIRIVSNSSGIILGADPTNDYKIMSTGQNGATVFNSLSKNIDSIFRSNAGGTILRVDSDAKRVGIRTDSPLSTLSVQGDSRFGDIDSSRTQISGIGTITLIGQARVTKEIVIKVEGLTLGASPPTQAVIGNFSVLQFPGTGAIRMVYTTFHVPKDWSSGTDIKIHIHWAPVNANAGTVVWKMTWDALASNNNEVISGAGTATSVPDATQTLQDELLESDDMTIAGASLALEDTIGLTIFRDPADGSDNYGSAASLVLVEIKYTADKLGEAI